MNNLSNEVLSNEAKLIHANNLTMLIEKLIEYYAPEISQSEALNLIASAEVTLADLGFETHSYYQSKLVNKIF
jgi:hypothetical protein